MNEPGSRSALPPPRSPAPTTGENDRTVFDWVRRSGEGEQLLAELDEFLETRRRRRRRAAMVAVAGVAVALWVWAPWGEFSPAPPPARTAEPLILRPTTRTLADGSIVELNAEAAIAVDLSGPMRQVTLRRGEAHFAVAKDPTRPFVVVARGIEVRAVGTAFAVGLGAGAVEVVVTEGRVALGRDTVQETRSTAGGREAPPALPTLEAGRSIVLGSEHSTPATRAPLPVTLTPEQIRERLAWRVPRFEFAGTPLARVVAMFNQHAAAEGGARLVLAEPELGHRQISGVLRADDIESLLRLLEGAFGIAAERRDGLFVLRRR